MVSKGVRNRAEQQLGEAARPTASHDDERGVRVERDLVEFGCRQSIDELGPIRHPGFGERLNPFVEQPSPMPTDFLDRWLERRDRRGAKYSGPMSRTCTAITSASREGAYWIHHAAGRARAL